MDIEIQNKNSEDNKLLYYFSIKGHVFSDGKNINILPQSVEVV